jgi:hypothetical protein
VRSGQLGVFCSWFFVSRFHSSLVCLLARWLVGG